MKKTIQNAIVGALALFGLFTIITGASSNENPNKSVYLDNSNFEMYKMEDNKIMIFNKQNGEIEYKNANGELATESIDLDINDWPSYLDIRCYQSCN